MMGPDTLPWWIDPSKKNNSNEGRGQLGYLSYDIFLGLSVLGGFFGLDHLYLRSPLTAIAKMWINMIFFGAWWIYDAVQAFFNSDIIKIYGLSIPGLGPKGIGAGCLAMDKEGWIPHKDHMSFFIYGLVLLFAGIGGVDSYIVGDKKSFIIRIVCLISVLFSPVAIIWWIYKVFMFLFQPTDVINSYPGFFGKAGGDLHDSFLMRIAKRIFGIVPDVLATSINSLSETGIKLTNVIEKIPETTKEILDNTKIVVDSITTPIMNDFPSITEALAKRSIDEKQLRQQGGMISNVSSDVQSNILSYVLMGTICIIAVSGFFSTYSRSKKNEPNDQPPEPGISGEFIKKSN